MDLMQELLKYCDSRSSNSSMFLIRMSKLSEGSERQNICPMMKREGRTLSTHLWLCCRSRSHLDIPMKRGERFACGMEALNTTSIQRKSCTAFNKMQADG